MTEIDRAVLADIDRIAGFHGKVPGDSRPMWQTLGAEHRRKIEQHGFDSFKRHINFQYGQWGISKFTSRFTLRVLTAILRRGYFPWGAFARVNWQDGSDIQWPQLTSTGRPANPPEMTDRRLRAYAVYCGLLWQYASIHDKLNCLRVPEPPIGRPIPIWLGGKLISQDLAMASLNLNRMASSIRLGGIRKVLEIGAGYGRLAYLFHSVFPQVEYSIVDISPTLAVSQNYLASVFGEGHVARFSPDRGPPRAFNFLLPNQLEQISDRYFDLVINISSFDEMPPEVSTSYLRSIERVCGGYVFLEGYGEASQAGRLGLDELPYNPAWRLLYGGSHEVFPNWVEKIFQIDRWKDH
jgi:putative sugar O-methyltransferase